MSSVLSTMDYSLQLGLNTYRFSERKHNLSLLNKGELRIGTLHDFRSMEHKTGIADPSEGKKFVTHDIDKLHVEDSQNPENTQSKDFRALLEFFPEYTQEQFSNLTIQGLTFRVPVVSPNVFLLCTSYSGTRKTMRQFEGADSCLRLANPSGFYPMLTEILSDTVPVVFRGVEIIQYHMQADTWNGADWGENPAVIKHPDYRRQKEMRAIWEPINSEDINPIIIADPRLKDFWVPHIL